MRRALAALVVALGTLAVMPAATHAAEPERILIVGDSVTQGAKGDHTWRYFLWREMENGQRPVDFVGSSTGVFNPGADGWDWNYTGTDAYADPDFDQDHAAVYGGTLQHDGHWILSYPVQTEIERHAPDIIVSLWALNDLGSTEQSVDDVVGYYRDWFARARSVDPTVDFVVAKLPQTWRYDGRVTDFNAKLETLATELRTEASQIAVAGVEGFTESDTKDGVHPNESGERKIATAVNTALAQVKPDPEPVAPAPVEEVPIAPVPPTAVPLMPVVEPVTTPVVTAPVAPTAPRSVKAVRHGKRVKVTWLSAAGRYVVKCGSRSRETDSRKMVLRTSAKRCSVQTVTEAGASPWTMAKVKQTTRR